jgi:translocation and assembly module TamB
MTLDSGLIRFDKSDPERPNIDMLGSASMLGYDITAVVSGPYDEPVVTLSSVPPLSNEELIMLLLSGQPPKSDQRRLSGGNRGANAAVFLGRDMLSRFSDNESENVGDLILDRFDIEVGRQITRRGEETINAKFLLADDIFLKGDSLYLTGEKDVFDYYNGGLRIVFRFR